MENNKDRIPKRIIDKILEDIRNGELVRGQGIPSEKELSKKYSTGRGSIREAIRALELIGILRTVAGKGTFVSNFSVSSLFNPAMVVYKPDLEMLPQLIEFRELFESIVVENAITNATEKDLVKIKENLDLLKFYADRKNIVMFAKLDYEFHQLISNSTHNEIIKSIYKTIFPLLKYSTTETIKVPDVILKTIRDHNKIFNSIESKDIDKAKAAIREHMKYVKEYVNKLKKIKRDS